MRRWRGRPLPTPSWAWSRSGWLSFYLERWNDAGLTDPLFWGSLVVALGLAGVAAYPVNKWLIGRGKGHAVMHGHH